MNYRISVDTGGTFTDVVVADETGRQIVAKALTTPERIFAGMRQALQLAGEELGHSLDDLLARTDLLIYGTTRATNAIVTGRVARTAFLTTEGFPDVLVLKEGGKFDPHDFSKDYPEPYIPRRHTFEISERMSSEGEVSRPLDEAQARRVLADIARRRFEAVAVCLLWSIANPAHEERVGELIEETLPGIPYTLSHRLLPIVREYRRASATAIDASLKPLMQKHLAEMDQDLRAAGYAGEILLSTAVGGCQHVTELVERPIQTVGSGPAMAPVAGLTYARIEELGEDVIVCDTGGTTFDVGLVRDGQLKYTRETWLGGQWTGHLMSISSVDVRSVGAGGGSIAWIDSGGLLRVGPQSAGAVPGPACYGQGGTEPTVTDAALVLGYLDRDFFLGGRMKLDVEAARQAVASIGARIRQSPEQAAYSIMTLANELMIKAIQEITVSEGFNPRDSALVAGGGAAGLNMVPIARELGCNRLVLPKTASALSACGMQFSDIVAEHTVSRVTTSANFDHDGVNAALQRIEDELQGFLQRLERSSVPAHSLELFVEARYQAQVWELDVPLPVKRFRSAADLAALVKAFHQVHERVFAVTDEGSGLECINWKGRLMVRLESPASPGVARPQPSRPATKTRRPAYFGGEAPVDTPIFRGSELAPGSLIDGPAIIEEPTTTIVVYPGASAGVSGANNYILEL